jgi:hypothetical protein
VGCTDSPICEDDRESSVKLRTRTIHHHAARPRIP